MSNKAVLPAGKDTIGVRYIEDEGTNIETILRSTNYVAGTSGYNFTLNGTAGTATLDAKDDVTISSNYSAGVSGVQMFMDGSAGTATLDAKGNISLPSNFSSGVSGSRININANGDIAQECALSFYMTPQVGFNVQAGSSVSISSNYVAATSGAQLSISGSAGTAGLTAKGDINFSSNYSSGVSGSRIDFFASGGAVQILGNGASSVFDNKPLIYLGNSNPGHVDHLKLAHNNDILINANYSAGVSGAQIFMDGSSGNATVTATSGFIELTASSSYVLLAASTVIGFDVNSAQAVRIFSSVDYRNFAIRDSTSASAANVYIDASTGQVSRSTSAAKYKTDIQPLSEESLEANLNIQGVFYRSLCENDCKQKIHVGIVADQAEQYAPWLMHYGVDSGLEGFQYERQTAFNLEHIKRLNAKLEDALERINELEEILYGEPDLDTL